MTREEQIEAGKIWVVYLDGKRDVVLFEGTGPMVAKLRKLQADLARLLK